MCVRSSNNWHCSRICSAYHSSRSSNLCHFILQKQMGNITSYDPFAEKLLKHFRQNPYYPFIHVQSYTYEYCYRRWSTAYLICILQTVLFSLAIYSYYKYLEFYEGQKEDIEYWLYGSELILLFTFSILTIFLCVNLVECLKQIRIVISALDLYVYYYVGGTLYRQHSLNKVYICLREVKTYDQILYHLVFIIEDVDLIEITDYFQFNIELRQLGIRLAKQLYIGYLESSDWIGTFPKYNKLKAYIRKLKLQHRTTDNIRESFDKNERSLNSTSFTRTDDVIINQNTNRNNKIKIELVYT
ncbi:unnamed protein product [Didymodactylos carnosus]|uniref:Uncharacterized protein n=1 Tax=Didymodactylos carnosus TaxID=1234261 RepID=A0A814I5T4_9BILA|nr:unnamed protein product [Didymodactylos carnosus]CAF3790007.1 unnamed protein product [Didymodactylos carnosus]